MMEGFESPEEMVAQAAGYHQGLLQVPMKKKPARVMAVNGDGSKKEEWTDMAVFCLLQIYGEKYGSVRRGSLSSRDWDDLALYVNSCCKDLLFPKTSDQCKYKIENMKRRYRLEKSKLDANEFVKVVWPYYSRMDQILGVPVAKVGIPRGMDAGGFVPLMEHSAHEGMSMSMLESHGIHDAAAEESQAESDLPSPSMLRSLKRTAEAVVDSDQDDPFLTSAMGGAKESMTNVRDEAFFKQIGSDRSRGKQQKLSTSSLGQDVASSIRGFAEVMLRIEHEKMELVKDLERQRAETELKRTEMLLNNQMQIVKLLSQCSRHRSGEPSESE